MPAPESSPSDLDALDPATARIAVVGPGAVGTFYAAQLSVAGRNVVACGRRPFDRYIVESDAVPVDDPAVALTDPADLGAAGFDGSVDLVIVTVKTFQTAGAASWLDALCGSDTIVAGAQNGVEEVERLTPYVNGAAVVPCVVYCGSELIAPGHIRHAQHGIMIVPDNAITRAVAPLFDGSAARWRPDENFVAETWRKLGINVMANGVTALTRRTMDVLGTHPVDDVARALLRECLTVARADGVEVDPSEADEYDLSVMPRYGTSMYQDVMADRPTEYEALHGAVLRAGERYGIDTPVTRVVYALLAGREAVTAPPSRSNADRFGPG
ncbi:MAG: 2-dehydropantoate 2-reductase [Acidimicrobiia bacterium]|nr:2-dehydropantoate 2-reductase [Acidimicrobiia bacterium]